ncbi:helix-turn-helix transcriptional regulator [Fusobacterium sp.]|uniref:helix-turn-helix domain-containing protein n=1 Tax=Fusobacterium sp. TaxID=68766 RepID=UPI0025C550ED|nr:helix-turn-helix transcriptional regulator [Fusobacterium sp.]
MANINKAIKNFNKLKFKENKITQEIFIEKYNLENKRKELDYSKFSKLLNGYVDNFTLKTLKDLGDIFEISYEHYLGISGYSYQNRELRRCFGENLKMYRKLKKMTQKEFAKEIGVSYCAYKIYESNFGNPRKNTLIRIANKLNISVVNLIK